LTGTIRLRLRLRRLLSAAVRLLFTCAIVYGAPALGAGYHPTLTQYAHAAWRIQDGDFDGQPSSIVQTRDGYLWIGTEGGLVRYDGGRFRRWSLPLESVVYALLADRDGSLWVGRGGDLVHVNLGQVAPPIKTHGRVNGLLQDQSGAIWLGRSRAPAHAGGLCKVVGASTECFGVAQKQPCDYAAAISHDPSGMFWIGSSTGVCTWRPGASGRTVAGGGAMDAYAVAALAAEPDGSMLVGYDLAGPRLGLERAAEGVVSPFRLPGLSSESLRVTALLRDREGALWIGTATEGIYHVEQGRVDHYTRADGLSGSGVNAFFQDREGNLWVATTGGLDRFHAHAILALTTREGLVSDRANSVLVRRDGSIWVSSTEGLSVIKDGKVVPAHAPSGLAGHSIASMAEDHAGRMWLGLIDDLFVLEGGRARSVRKPDGGKLGVLVGLTEDGTGDMWALSAGRPYRLYRIHAGTKVEEVSIPGNRVPYRIAAGPGGAIWITDSSSDLDIYRSGQWTTLEGPGPRFGFSEQLLVTANGDVILSTEKGAFYRRGDRWTLLNVARGLPCENLFSAVVDLRGDLWLRGQCGTMIIAALDLQHALETPSAKLPVRLLDGVDGSQPGVASFQPAVAASRDGRLWFATDNVLLTADPSTLPSNRLPPPVHIEQLVADHRTYGLGRSVVLPPRTRDVEISYSGLSFVAPQKTHFRYRLTGVDEPWQEVGARRTAFYMNLKPGKYRFQVIASNNDGVWNTAGDAVDFEIRPTFFQTLWFQALAVVLLIGLVWLGLWLRVRSVAAEIEARLSERQAERIRIARELHDTLLQGFQGLLMRFQVVADAIPRRSPAKPMMEAVLSRAEDVLVEGRDRVHDLRTAEDGPSALREALLQIVVDLEQASCGPIEVVLVGVPRPLGENTQREILAIAKEALTNACRHAQATQVVCLITFTHFHVRVCCQDNGIGIDGGILSAGGREGHWGMTGMRERAKRAGGALTVQSVPGQTRVTFCLNTWAARLRALGERLPWLAAKT
jgi:ligand-binding sensor domain-containing protein/anti-sigma regulatory factor (Ser/Thr protein kinase)